LGQLTRENNVYANLTYTYEYDDAGNILYKRTYAYTTGTLGTVQSTISYGYNNANWGDLLTINNGNTVSYDAIGNPTTYWVGYNDYYMSWTGRQLDSVNIMGMDNTTYTYNESGIRTAKNRNGTVYSYTLDGSKILKETRGASTTLYYYYDDAGSITGFTYNGTNYYYGKNIQGDVKYIYDTNGTVVVEYCYDAWGNIISVTGSLASTIGVINPFRYRSYYYDNETGFYYLNSRYYDPQVGRFINADGIVGANQDLLGYNLFAYCFNNVVNMFDVDGYWPESFIKLFVKEETWAKLNTAEREVACKDPLGAKSMGKAWTLVDIWGKKMMGSAYFGDDNKGNAFRHAFWSAAGTFMIGYSRTKVFTDAHENGQSSASSKMDLFNNLQGRKIGKLYAEKLQEYKRICATLGNSRLKSAPKVTYYFFYYNVRISLRGDDYSNIALMVKVAIDKGVLTWLK